MKYVNLCVAFKGGAVARLTTAASIAPDIISEWSEWVKEAKLGMCGIKRVDNNDTGKPAYAFRIEEVAAMWQEDM